MSLHDFREPILYKPRNKDVTTRMVYKRPKRVCSGKVATLGDSGARMLQKERGARAAVGIAALSARTGRPYEGYLRCRLFRA
jgi:hypothetical protein